MKTQLSSPDFSPNPACTPTRIDANIPFRIFSDTKHASRVTAGEIATLIRQRASEGRMCVLGLVTGSSPVNVYSELVRMHREEGLSLSNVVTFNLDEYFPMDPGCLQSYARFMHEHLFDHVDIAPQNIHIPDGTIDAAQMPEYCARYEERVAEAGGVDLQLLGIGRTGHIGFNEPGSGTDSRTRIITLDGMTRIDAASDFFGVENVPRRAITMGVGVILKARRILLLAFGEGKAGIVARTIEGEIAPSVPATSLQKHPNAEFLLDLAAAAKLKQVESPWLADDVLWDDTMVRRAAISLSQQLEKPILMLTDGDYNENGLQSLLAEYGSAYEINLRAFGASAKHDHGLARRQTRTRRLRVP